MKERRKRGGQNGRTDKAGRRNGRKRLKIDGQNGRTGRERLERQGDETVDMIRRHEEEEEEEKRLQAEGMSAGDEYRMM